ncbi:mannan endo-1,4-beta-mannosidase [Mariniphaga anaerophila]|uniref:Mannan endo-1,4-beta-mannosidase n=1 Tax=Mariniphaga anaerophila TaxID=1484053 RepID=A0A1M5CWV0_9BACT|nr:glycosyl hydrolase [Mariniphaga anaerophila]SHF59208.1 mannan endo-1,4-beta-mannosidase [Mariniphaga anaerophila]
MKKLLVISFLILGIAAFAQKPHPADSQATPETVNLYRNLLKLQHEGIMFGHQDDLAYGEGWVYEEGRSDVKDVCSDYPAVYGWELGHLELGDAYSLDSVHFDKIQGWIKTVYKRGGVNTISWHLRNPLTGGTSWDTSSKEAVKSILPGGEKHELFKQYLNRLANFMLGLKTADGTYIPVLFRPFHEHTGSWFWWGKDLCSVNEYTALWRFTANYLQQKKGIHHILYAYSTDRFQSESEYLERYPGDDVVDMLGFDLYDRGSEYLPTLKNCATFLTKLAKEKGKIAAVSETGGPIAVNHQWWTQLLETLRPFDLAYVLVWRNPWHPAGHGAFAPYKSSPDSENFIKFYNDKKTLFQKDVTPKKLYK